MSAGVADLAQDIFLLRNSRPTTEPSLGPPSGSVFAAATTIEARGRNNLTVGENEIQKSEGEFEHLEQQRSEGFFF